MYRDAGYIEHIPYIFICAGYKKGGKDSCEVMEKIRVQYSHLFKTKPRQYVNDILLIFLIKRPSCVWIFENGTQ